MKVKLVTVREAYAAHLISENPYQNFKLDRGKRVARKFLTKEELTKLETKQIDDMCLNRVRDLFLFCCYTGLAYADLAIFNFKDAIDVYKRQIYSCLFYLSLRSLLLAGQTSEY